MKMSTATLIFAAAALAAPAAVGQSEGTPTRALLQPAAESAQIVPVRMVGSFDLQGEPRASGFAVSVTPDPAFAWIMALGFLGLVVARRVS